MPIWNDSGCCERNFDFWTIWSDFVTLIGASGEDFWICCASVICCEIDVARNVDEEEICDQSVPGVLSVALGMDCGDPGSPPDMAAADEVGCVFWGAFSCAAIQTNI